MLIQYIASANSDILKIIEITSSDIDDIKLAHHDELFKRNKIKDELIVSFENKKSLINSEISKLISQNRDKSLDELLSDDIKNGLDEFQKNLALLKDINKKYARMVLAVSEFYNSVIERLIPTEMQGYKRVNSKSGSSLELRV
ncbi:MAG: hypothetical protein HXX81_06890 [Campylobacterales bacterium]|nr:hypothetical protein [Campylobacterales bacterium]